MPKASPGYYGSPLESLIRRADPTARVYVRARVESPVPGGTNLKQSYSDFAGCDGGVPATAELLADGGVALLPSVLTGGPAGDSNITAGIAGDPSIGGLGPFIGPWSYATGGSNILAAHITLPRLGSSPVRHITQVQLYLYPRRVAANPKTVTKWWLTIYSEVGPGQVSLTPLARISAPANTEAPGWVTFTIPNIPLLSFNPLAILCTVEGRDGAGNAATNIGWGYDTGTTGPVTDAARDSAYGVTLYWIPLGVSPGQGNIVLGNGVPNIQVQFAEYVNSNVTIAFTGANVPSLAAVPTVPPELTAQAETPPGTSAVFQVLADDGTTWVPYTDGQTTDQLVNVGLHQTYKMRVLLSPDSSQLNSPIVRGIGIREITPIDLSDICQVRSVQWVLNPVNHKAEISECTLEAIHDGDRDFRDAITTLLSNYPIGNILLRLFISAPSLSRGIGKNGVETFTQGLWLDDFLIDDYDLGPGSVTLTCVNCLALLRQALPILTSEIDAYPIADQSNSTWVPSTGTALFPQLADLTTSGTASAGPTPDDATYISCHNGNNSQCVVQLSTLGIPTLPGGAPQLAGIAIALHAAYQNGAPSANPVLEVELGYLTGGSFTPIASANASYVLTNQASLATATWQQLQLLLSPTVVGAITTLGVWGSLYLRFTAGPGGITANGYVGVSWSWLRQLGLRYPLVYSNATWATIVADLIKNQVGLDGRYVGTALRPDPTGTPTYLTTGPYGTFNTPVLALSKTISGSATPGSTDLSDAKNELDWLGFVSGTVTFGSQGKLKNVALYQIGAGPQAGSIVFTPGSPNAAGALPYFPSEELEPVSVTPGFRQRVPIYWLLWGYDPINNPQWRGESEGYQGIAFTALGAATIDPIRRAESGLAQWVSSQVLADALTVRHVMAFGLGLLQWRFKTSYAHPELDLSDVVLIDTDRFVVYDPTVPKAIAGAATVSAIIVGIHDVWGREFTVWVPPGIAGNPYSGPPSTNPPVTHPSWVHVQPHHDEILGGILNHSWVGGPAVQAVKIAVSTVSQPVAGTGTVYAGSSGQASTGPYGEGATVYVTITPYADAGATLNQGTPVYKTLMTRTRYRAQAVRSTVQSISNNTPTTLSFNVTDVFDVGALHDPVGAPTKMVIPAGIGVGAWCIVAQVDIDGNATGYRNLSIQKNGGAFIANATVAVNSAGANTIFSVVAFDSAASAGDYYEVVIYQNSGVALNVNFGVANTFFAAYHMW